MMTGGQLKKIERIINGLNVMVAVAHDRADYSEENMYRSWVRDLVAIHDGDDGDQNG